MINPTDSSLAALAREVGARLREAGRRLVTAESCTGGWIAKLCTDIAGSSTWFDCGFVCYSYSAKTRDLGVPAKLLEDAGAVSDAVVRAMAEGALRRCDADVAIAVSGIAGPDGATPGKPVGTVWFALAQKIADRVECQLHLMQFDGNRDAVRRHAVEYALNLLRALPVPATPVLRLFFALQPSAAEGAALLDRVRPLIPDGAQPVPAENLHATLCFVGAVAPEKLACLRDAAASVRASAVTLRFTSVEYWDQPKVLCATASDDADTERVQALSRDLSSAAMAAGFAPDVKTFRAHLTLARKMRVAAGDWPRSLEPALRMHCARFALMESRRGENGSVYSVVESWPLDSGSES